MTKGTVLVIGGGPAGIVAALRLSQNGYTVKILEASSELGGRLASAPNGEMSILWGWQRATRTTLQRLGTLPTVEQGPSGRFSLLLPGQHLTKLRRPWLPGPLGLLLGLGGLRALSWKDRWRLLNEIERRWESGEILPTDLDTRTARDWLLEMDQSELALRRVWTPLSRFLTGQDAAFTSAATFIEAVCRCLLSGWKNSRLSMPATTAHTWLIDPARHELQRLGATIRYGSPVEHLRCDAQRVITAHLKSGEALSADWYVTAVPARSLTPLVPERAVTRFSYFQQLGQLRETAVLIVQCRVDHAVLPPEVRLLSEGPFHWALIQPFNARVTLVTTQASEMLERNDTELTTLAAAELVRILSPSRFQTDQMKDCLVSRQPHAGLCLNPGSAALRPMPQSPFSNLFLAGDWTDTGMPPSLESAILSGERCAQAIMANGEALWSRVQPEQSLQ